MKTTKHFYTSTRKRYTIFRPHTLLPVIYQGSIAHEKIDHPPIEFRNGRFSTQDADIIAYLENHPGFGRDFFPVPVAEVKAQTKAAGIVPDPVPDPVPNGLESIEGVTNRNLAIQALVERGVDPGVFDRTTKKDGIIEIARGAGFEFVGY